MRAKYFRNVAALLYLVILFLPGANIAHSKQDPWPCEDNMKLLLDKSGKRIWFGTDKLKKRVTHQVAPKIPSSCKCKGTIWVDVLVNTEGQVQCVRAKLGHPLLKQAAIDAAKQWKFQPIVINGEKFAVFGRLAFRFST